jgi:glycosyltransferase involved in cell wall biosynthesis
MRIGIDARLWNETGVGRYIRNLVKNLLEIDSRNEYVLFLDSKACQEFKIQNSKLKITNKNLKLIETDIRWHTIDEQIQFPKVLKNEKLDLVHFPYFSVPVFYTSPFVITIHDLIINHFPTGKATTLPAPLYYIKYFGYQYVINRAAKRAEKIITVSQATKDEIVKHLGVSENKIVMTYEGVDDSVESKVKGQKSKVQIKNQKFLLYVGNAYPHKNLERLVDAFKLVVTEYPDIKIIFIGKEDYFYLRLKERVKALAIEKQVMFAGYVSENDLRQYYQSATVTIIPSLMEGFGLTGLEAMQAGSLVLASDIPSLKEIYQDAAVYFDPLAAGSIHATILEVLKKPNAFDSYREKGKKRALFFSWEKMAEETLKIYESCVSIRSD